MDFSRLAGRIAVDKTSKKLGKIIRIDDLPGKTIKRLKPYAMVYVYRLFKPDIVIPLDIDLLKKEEGYYVWFDILKIDFDKMTKQQSSVNSTRKTYGLFTDAPGSVKHPMIQPRNKRRE